MFCIIVLPDLFLKIPKLITKAIPTIIVSTIVEMSK